MASAPAVSGALLAGGASRRMGRDKRLLDVDGVALLARAAAALGAVCAEVHVVTSSDADRHDARWLVPDRDWLVDLRPGQGPLAALETALAHASHDVVVVLAGDHPAAVPAVLELLVSALADEPQAEAAVLVTDHGPQPLVAAYRRRALGAVRGLLDDGVRRAQALVDHLHVVGVEPASWHAHDPAGTTAVDLDTPEDLRGLRALRDVHTAGREVAGREVAGRQVEVAAHRIGVSPDGVVPRRDVVAVEEPLEIRACGPGQAPRTLFTTLRTPGHDAELAVGWLFAEGLAAPGEILGTTIGDVHEVASPTDQRTVHLSRPLDDEAVVHRHTVASAACGVCGRASIAELVARCTPIADADEPFTDEPVIDVATLHTLPVQLRDAQSVFAATGGLHAAAIATPTGRLLTVREDIGRHNALDAAIGAHVLAGDVPLRRRIVVLSGRAGFELVAKAAVAGAPVVAAVGAASGLAVRTAQQLGITLVGFLRDGRGTVYTYPQRIADLPRPATDSAPRPGP